MKLILRLADATGPDRSRTLDSDSPSFGTLSIGRGADNDWVLADPDRTLSKNHCRIDVSEGYFMLTDLSTNGVFLAGAPQPVGRGHSVALEDGDGFTLGPYRMQAEIVGDEADTLGFDGGMGLAQGASPLAPEIEEPWLTGLPGAGFGPSRQAARQGWDAPPDPATYAASGVFERPGAGGLFEAPAAAGSFDRPQAGGLFDNAADGDPLDRPGSGGRVPSEDQFGGEAGLFSQHDEHIAAAATVMRLPQAQVVLPTNWMDSEPAPAPAPAPAAAPSETAIWPPLLPPEPPPPEPAPSLPPEWAVQVEPGPAPLPLPSSWQAAQPAPQPPVPAAWQAAQPDPQMAQPVREAEIIPLPRPAIGASALLPVQPQVQSPVSPIPAPAPVTPASVTELAPRSPPAAPPVAPAPPASTGSAVPASAGGAVPASNGGAVPALTSGAASASTDPVAAFLEGAGLPADTLAGIDPDTALREIGQMVRAAVEGVRDIMSTRALVKSEFRVDQTVLRRADNNQVKFAPDTQRCLAAMVGAAPPGFLPGPAAMQQSMDDIKLHELALVAALNSVFADMGQQLDPDAIMRRARQETGLSAMMPYAREAKCWAIYMENYKLLQESGAANTGGSLLAPLAQAYARQLKRGR